MKLFTKGKEFIIRSLQGHSKMQMGKLRPQKFEFNIADLTKMHHLRRWYVKNTNDLSKALEYTQELELLHNELNNLAMIRLLRNLLIFTILFFIYDKVFMIEGGDNLDFQPQYSLTHQNKVYGNLAQGGLEDSLN